jgi:UDP-glucose 4-epimerase
MEDYKWLFTLPALSVLAQVGMIIHFLKQKVQGESLGAIGTYFKDNFKSTLIAVVVTQVATFGTFFTLATGTTIDLVAVFGIGYTIDSFFNKWDKQIQ